MFQAQSVRSAALARPAFRALPSIPTHPFLAPSPTSCPPTDFGEFLKVITENKMRQETNDDDADMGASMRPLGRLLRSARGGWRLHLS